MVRQSVVQDAGTSRSSDQQRCSWPVRWPPGGHCIGATSATGPGGRPFPEDPYEQLLIAIKAVFGSWGGKRAVDYRRQFNITPAMANGTAVNICTMVFGNRGDDSGTGVGFTRDPGTGENVLYGEYLVNA